MEQSKSFVALIRTETLGYVNTMRTGTEKRDLGRRGELVAEQFLHSQEYVVIARNYRCPYGELDLIMRDRETLVFVEVRTLSGSTFGDPLASVTFRKQRQIIKAASHYLSRCRLGQQAIRFDVIGIVWENLVPHVTHVKEAFELPSSYW